MMTGKATRASNRHGWLMDLFQLRREIRGRIEAGEASRRNIDDPRPILQRVDAALKAGEFVERN